MRILIADDHPVVRRGLRDIVASEHDMIVVGEAKSGDEALDLANKLEWDVAVFDYAMPGCSGADLVREVKRQYPARPVLVLSILPEEVHAGQVFKAGGAGYINKGSANEDLTGAIRKVVGGGKYVSPAFAEKLATELAEGGEQPPHVVTDETLAPLLGLLGTVTGLMGTFLHLGSAELQVQTVMPLSITQQPHMPPDPQVCGPVKSRRSHTPHVIPNDRDQH